MPYVDRSKYKGTHAPLSPSSPNWIHYDEEKLRTYMRNLYAKQRGTRLHELAEEMIRLGIKPQRSKKTFNTYTTDAINFGMTPEEMVFYSPNIYGTSDAILFENGTLRIHDLKTGTVTQPKMDQLRIYAALYCLDHGIDPRDIETELRIYWNDEVFTEKFDISTHREYMNLIEEKDRICESFKQEIE